MSGYHSREEWRAAPGLEEGSYEVSSLGRVRSLDRVITKVRAGKPVRCRAAGRVLKQQLDRDGYYTVEIAGNRRRVHRLVCEAFHGPPTTARPVTNHKNGQKVDNRFENLEWVSVSENTAHYVYELGGHLPPYQGISVILTNLSGQLTFSSAQKAAEFLKVTPGAVKQALRRGQRCCGYFVKRVSR
jgi:DNA-directed RNA polymerase specialized sigma24 family protein